MCRGSAARALYEAETLEQQTMHLHKCDHVFFLLGKKKWGGGGVVRLTAKPRYLLLLHRGEKKSNTVTALLKIVRYKHTLVKKKSSFSLRIRLAIVILHLKFWEKKSELSVRKSDLWDKSQKDLWNV